MAEGITPSTSKVEEAIAAPSVIKEEKFLSEQLGNKAVTEIPGIEQVHAAKLRGKGIRKVWHKPM
jgi:Barrier to autointegration factor